MKARAELSGIFRVLVAMAEFSDCAASVLRKGLAKASAQVVA